MNTNNGGYLEDVIGKLFDRWEKELNLSGSNKRLLCMRDQWLILRRLIEVVYSIDCQDFVQRFNNICYNTRMSLLQAISRPSDLSVANWLSRNLTRISLMMIGDGVSSEKVYRYGALASRRSDEQVSALVAQLKHYSFLVGASDSLLSIEEWPLTNSDATTLASVRDWICWGEFLTESPINSAQ